jgi:hypothetical protein
MVNPYKTGADKSGVSGTTGRNPLHHVAEWRKALDRKETYHTPHACNKEAVVNVVDAYIVRPWLSHPWIEWMLLDALVWREASSVAEEIEFTHADILNPARWRRSRLAAFVSRKFDQQRAQAVHSSTEPLRSALGAILSVYAGLAGIGDTISGTRVRETLVSAEATGARWEPACYALLDLVAAREPPIWCIANRGPLHWPW